MPLLTIIAFSDMSETIYMRGNSIMDVNSLCSRQLVLGLSAFGLLSAHGSLARARMGLGWQSSWGAMPSNENVKKS